MNKESLDAAVYIAKQFILRAEGLEDETGYYMGSRKSAEVKRASMELTRALADLRKPG